MNLFIHDPSPFSNDYLSKMYFEPLRQFKPVGTCGSISDYKDCTVLIDAHLLTPEAVAILKNNNCKIVGFSVTDSSYVSQCCREAKHLKNIDLMFMLTGIQKVNHGHEMIVTTDFNIALEKRQFLPDEDWAVFHSMHQQGRLQSLPYVHWEQQPSVISQPYSLRSQKVLIRGGHHMRRFILALKLMEIDRLDINSGFVTEPYFQDSMNPQFRYCDECRRVFKEHKKYPFSNTNLGVNCCNKMWGDHPDMSDLGQWNNRCPQSFHTAGFDMGGDPKRMEILLNSNWLPQKAHLEMLARITFTSDLKWLFSIYAAQRFWDAAMVGCVNLLPMRTTDQEYFPKMNADDHYVTFTEDLNNLNNQTEITESKYNHISKEARKLYDDWMRVDNYAISSNLLRHIFKTIDRFAK